MAAVQLEPWLWALITNNNNNKLILAENANDQISNKRKTELYHGRSLKGHNGL
jgi:hypothetical protein